MKSQLQLLIALAAYQCCTALPNTNAGDVVPETKFDQLPLVTAISSVDQVRHLPANKIISFLQADDSQCRAVSTALKSEVNTLIASDQAAFNALDTGTNCPSTFQTEVNSAQTAVNNVQTAVAAATQAQAAATGSSAPITITISFTTTPSLNDFTQTSAWAAAQSKYNAAVLTVATKQGELDEAKKNLVTAQSKQTEMIKACRCTAKAKYDVAVAQAQPHEAPNAASWRKAEKVICALDATTPCPSNPPAKPTAPTLPAEVASVSQCMTASSGMQLGDYKIQFVDEPNPKPHADSAYMVDLCNTIGMKPLCDISCDSGNSAYVSIGSSSNYKFVNSPYNTGESPFAAPSAVNLFPSGWTDVRDKMFKYQLNVCFYHHNKAPICSTPQPSGNMRDWNSAGAWKVMGPGGSWNYQKILSGKSGMSPAQMTWGAKGSGYDYTKEKRVACAKKTA